jgi:hypothetical protein
MFDSHALFEHDHKDEESHHDHHESGDIKKVPSINHRESNIDLIEKKHHHQ